MSPPLRSSTISALEINHKASPAIVSPPLDLNASQTAREPQDPQPSRKSEDPFSPVLHFLRSLNPSLEELAPRFRKAGIKNTQRLRAVASWEAKRRWLAETIELDAFEEELLMMALDEVEDGTRQL